MKVKNLYQILLIGICIGLTACKDEGPENKQLSSDQNYTHTFFQLLDSSATGVGFINEVADQGLFNVLTYRNFYNGGGVAIGDINNDELPDLYFTSNLGKNRLYLNQGGFKFKDITNVSNTAGTKSWSTGATMVDINADGKLDIYVSNSGDVEGDAKENELFINQGNNAEGVPTFSEEASVYGLNNAGYSTQAAFFDYDRDGDLDCYLLNNSFRDPGRIELFKSMRDKPDPLGGDKLYRNDGGKFVDVTLKAGIYSSEIGFGLGAAVGDLNNDDLPDIYVSNDFWERDYLYINQGDGTFAEELIDRINLCSVSSMGGDIADLNNDGHPEIFSTDMLAGDNKRIKANTSFDPFHLENMKYRANYHYQFVQNCLHLNDGQGKFQEISLMSGVAATDWSWGALIFDFENDGRKDIFVSNGIAKDVMSMDFRDFLADNDMFRKAYLKEAADYDSFIDKMPTNAMPNYAFSNNGSLQFRNQAQKLGLDQMSFSNGAAYADLDNDGDMDLVVNNVNMPSFIYRNEARERLQNHYLKIHFKGPEDNPFGIGSKVTIKLNGRIQVLENYNTRGFESAVEPLLLFGLGKSTKVDELTVKWPDGKVQVMNEVMADKLLEVAYQDAVTDTSRSIDPKPIFTDASSTLIKGDSRHRENQYNDFDHEPLLLGMLSTDGPRLIKGDVNNDGKEDVIVLGARNDADKLFIQGNTGSFSRKNVAAFNATRKFESTCGTLFDHDGDGDLDLLLGAGGNEYQLGGEVFSLRYFSNDGAGNFKLDQRGSPQVIGNFSTIVHADIEGDGDQDVFIGGKIVPGNYGLPPRSFLFINDNGEWREATPDFLAGPGMVTDAVWTDVDGDKDPDLVIVGDWMAINVYNNEQGILGPPNAIPGSKGWWNRLIHIDLDKDGDQDFVIGNWGLNSKFKASVSRPLSMYVNDFDQNGKSEFVINWYPPLESKAFPFASKVELTTQLPALRKSVLTYEAFASQTYESLFPADIRQRSIPYQANFLESAILWNEGNGSYSLSPLPEEAQISPAYALVADDLDGDGNTDIWLGGNFYGLKPQVGRNDASRGVFLKGDGGRNFRYLSHQETGIYVEGESRDAVVMTLGDQKGLLIGRNNEGLKLFVR